MAKKRGKRLTKGKDNTEKGIPIEGKLEKGAELINTLGGDRSEPYTQQLEDISEAKNE